MHLTHPHPAPHTHHTPPYTTHAHTHHMHTHTPHRSLSHTHTPHRSLSLSLTHNPHTHTQRHTCSTYVTDLITEEGTSTQHSLTSVCGTCRNSQKVLYLFFCFRFLLFPTVPAFLNARIYTHTVWSPYLPEKEQKAALERFQPVYTNAYQSNMRAKVRLHLLAASLRR